MMSREEIGGVRVVDHVSIAVLEVVMTSIALHTDTVAYGRARFRTNFDIP